MLQLYIAIWRVSAGRQLVLIALSIAIAALAALPLKFQQGIVNTLTDGQATAESLFLLGAGMLVAILISLALKWLMGQRSGVLGEDIIRLLRRRLYSDTNRNQQDPGAIQTGTLTTAISAEAEELGKFAGSAFCEPVVQIGTLISVIGFIASTQPGLGAIALAMIGPQVLLVLFTQRKINTMVASRVRVLRNATDQISRAQAAAVEKSVLEDFDRIFETRRRMFIWKLSTKFMLSTINGIGTVSVLMLGGWLVLQGRTDVGTVVAATLGLSRLQGPTAFLIAFYRQVSANRVKFELLRDILPHRAPAR